MEISKQYEPIKIENKWYALWMEKNFFASEPDNRTPYTIVIPPPNVTGVLHMGHMLNNTIQDVIIRRARMKGFNACWVPGTDHASIATEAKVVAKLKSEGIDKKDITREEFLKHAWDWKEKHGGIILEQLKKLGASCDWERTKFTMDEDLSESVIDVFIDLYNKGYIYRGVRMVNWDPKALTALSDEEVNYKEVQSKLYYLNYPIEGENGSYITIATTRPETILGDTAICVHPNDERYKHLKGKNALLPLIGRKLPIIYDEYVEMEFGTGALKVTPAHDINDYQLGIKHHLQSIDIFNDNGTLNEKATLYIGEDRFEVREKIVKELTSKGLLNKVEAITNNVGYSERTDEVIEPKLSIQWFCDMKSLAKPALEVVMNDTIKFHPAKFKNTYRHWMENVKDWCISRQLWWGHRIPAYYLPNGEYVVAKNIENALEIAKTKFNLPDLTSSDLKQDEDVLDTWFSSWLWPISVFDGIRYPDKPDIKYYYPTNDLVTAPEILFFWVARMIMAGIEYQKEIPFKNVYLTGIVRDKLGRKMSKSLGNSPDPIELMQHYGADGVRMGMLLSSPAGNDLLFDDSQCEQGRNFCNKIWNALRLVKSWAIEEKIEQPAVAKQAIEWFNHLLAQNIKIIDEHFDKYRLSDALMQLYKLIWEEFCSWYLELIKPAYQQPIDAKTYNETIAIFEELIKLLHPFMPFITEEIWHLLKDRNNNDFIIVAPMPAAKAFKQDIIEDFEFSKDVIIAIRNIRKEKNIQNKESIRLLTQDPGKLPYKEAVIKLCNIQNIEKCDNNPEQCFSFIVKTSEFYIPISQNIDIKAEINKIEEEIKYYQGFLVSVNKKLSNQSFVANAPKQVVENEEKKKADAETKLQMLEQQMKQLKQ